MTQALADQLTAVDRAPRYRWFADARDVMPGGGGPLPLLVPADAARRARWTAALRWLGAIDDADDEPSSSDGDDAGERADRIPESEPARDWVLALGGGAELAARVLGGRLGRGLARAAGPRAAAAWIEAQRPRSVLVVAPQRQLTADALLVLTAAAQRRGARWGALTGVDAAGLLFSAAKAVLAGRAAPERDLLLDALDGTELAFVDGREQRRVAGDALVREAWRLVTVLAHGEGGHADLGATVLCGLAGRREAVADDELSRGCVHRRFCKRAHGRRLASCLDLRVRVCALLSCNSASLAGQLYPSNVGLAHALGEGFASAVIAVVGRVAPAPGTARALRELIAAGRPLGEVAADLNELCAAREPLPPFVLLGDPLLRCATARAAAGAAALEWVALGAEDHAPVVTLAHDADAPFLRGPARALVPAGRQLADRSEEAARAAALARDTARQLATLEALEQALAALGGCEPEPEARRMLVLRLAGARRRTAAAARDLLREAGIAHREGMWRSVVGELEGTLRDARSEWDAAVAELILHAPDNAVFDALHHYHEADPPARGARCARCRSATLVVRHRDSGLGLAPRESVECPVCGPLAEHGVNEPRVEVLAPRSAVPGTTWDVRVRVAEPPALPAAAWLVAELVDKAAGRALHRARRRLDPHAVEARLPLPIPPETRPDIHTARVLRVGGLRVAFARVRLEVLDPPAAG